MAEAVVSPLLKQLAAVASDQFWSVLGVRSDLRKLESTLSVIQDVIQDAEERSVTERNVRNWVAKLKDAAYDVDDLLDEFLTTDAQWRQQDTTWWQKVRIFFSPSNPLAFRIKMSFEIKGIVEKLAMIAQERDQFQLRGVPPSDALQRQTENRMTTHVIDEPSVYGRDNDVDEILKLLLEKKTDKEEEEHLSVITIVGMGGLGKTTLAQLAFNHERVVKQKSFDSRIWVCVSDQFDIKRIAKAIIEFATKEPCNFSELAAVVDRVREILEKKRFLLVLDDVWNKNENDWERLKNILAVGARGSKILVTTRNENIARVMGTTSLYLLGVLSNDDCWRLFEKRAFRSVQRDPSLEAIGREILAKSGGSPLAVKTLGSLMSCKTQREEWRAVRDSDEWTSTEEGNQVMASLKLSYNHLSPVLKQCFAYCSIFPKDTRIKMYKLVLHWIAMGFIPCNASLVSALNKGQEYFNNLVWTSFLDHGDLNINYYKMHDLVHDLAKSVAGDEQFIYYADARESATIPQRCRFCTLVGISKESELKHLFQKSRKIRALRIKNSNINTSILFTSLPRLRVLAIEEWTEIKEVHSSINRLKHLRYFRVGRNRHISQLPNSIGELPNLLVLHASSCIELRSVPESIGKLANLRTLNLSDCEALHSLPQSLGNLSNLEELDLEGCKNIAELPESIGKLANLRFLRLSSCNALHSLPQSLGNLSNLEELDLRGMDIAELPESIGKLANLRILQLSYCNALHSLPQSLSNLSNLEELDLQWCREIAELPKGMGNMTNLRHLRNKGMESLRGMPLGIGKMRSLLTLQLFVVGEGINHSSIAEMQHLNLIEGELALTGLENVKSPGDAARANMKEKHGLQSLCLRWFDCVPLDPDSLIHEEVLVDLIQHSNLEKLEIERYPGINFPNLVELKLCRLESLPPFAGVLPPCLKKLHIEVIYTQTNLELSGGGSFPLLKLEELRLSDMPNLEEWFTVMAGVELYPRLEELYIRNCPKMQAEPCIPASVKRLKLWYNSNEVLNSVGRAVQGVDLQGVSCGALEELTIACSDEMVDLPEAIRSFTFLRTLDIYNCPNLARLPEWLRELTSLKRLNIIGGSSSLKERCKKDTGEDWPIIANIPEVNILW